MKSLCFGCPSGPVGSLPSSMYRVTASCKRLSEFTFIKFHFFLGGGGGGGGGGSCLQHFGESRNVRRINRMQPATKRQVVVLSQVGTG